MRPFWLWLWQAWKGQWCEHENMIRGVLTIDGREEPWSQCLTCGRRFGAPKADKPEPKVKAFWKPPNFP